MSALVAEAPNPRAVIVAIHGGGTTALYFDCPGHPELSLLRTGAQHGYTVVAIDRPGYGSSAAYPDAVAEPEQRVRLAYGAVDRVLGERPRGAGLFLMAHSGGCELALRMARRTCRAAHRSDRHRTGRHRAALPSRGAGDPESRHPRPPSGGPARTACGIRPNCIRPKCSGAQRFIRVRRLTRTRWCRTGRVRTSRRSHPPCGFRCNSASPSTRRSGRPMRRRWPRSRRCSRTRHAFRSTNNLGPATTSASVTRPLPTIRRFVVRRRMRAAQRWRQVDGGD